MTNSKKMYKVKEAFGIEAPDHMMIEGYEKPGVYTPKLSHGYLFRKEWFRDFYAWFAAGNDEGMYMTGPTGCGKTSFVQQFHAVLNLPLHFLPGNKRTEPIHLLGTQQLIGGDTLFVDGPLTTAARLGHTFLLNEGDLVTPACNAILHAVVEGYPLVLASNGGEVVHPEPGFRVVIDGNSAGQGDINGSYGTQRQSLAFMDRFWVMDAGYMEKADEMKVLKSVTSLSEAITEKMVDVANDVRNLYMGVNDTAEAIDQTFSTRTIIRWARLTELFKTAGHPVSYALGLALTNRASAESKAVIEQLVQRHFGDDV